jgi:ABC-type bacteriocin/lantibiotic exporter with double-glycine peptidase domain
MLCYQLTATIIMTAAILWATLSNGLVASETFTALAIVVITALAMARLMQYYPLFMSAVGCFQRIQLYLELDERQDGRRTMSDVVMPKSQGSEKDSSDGSQLHMEKSEAESPAYQSSIAFIDASIAPTAGTGPVLRSVNVSIPRSKLAVVLGRTGAGKSTLLRSIIGEATITEGSIYVEQCQIAYCDQNPWLRNVSVRDNIIGDSVQDANWYQTVVEACLLDEDIKQWHHGDQTMSGDAGSNLSGGQKQRIVSP